MNEMNVVLRAYMIIHNMLVEERRRGYIMNGNGRGSSSTARLDTKNLQHANLVSIDSIQKKMPIYDFIDDCADV